MQTEDPIPLRRFLIPGILIAAATVAINHNFLEEHFFGQSVWAAGHELSSDYNSQTVPLMKAGFTVTAEPMQLEDGSFAAETGPLGIVYDTTPGGAISRYTVRPGDTVETIAKTFDISKNTIIWANDLKRDSVIAVGQELVILPVSGVRYVVKQNSESLAAVAKKFGGDADEIETYNGLESKTLAKGTELIIPDGEITAEPVKKAEPKKGSSEAPKVTNSDDEHVYDENEKPAKLATRVSVAQLKDAAGYFMVPLKTGIRTQKLHGLNGIDIGAPVGTSVYAAAAGTVIAVKSPGGWNGGYGGYVVIKHDNGTQTLYAHLSKVLTSVGASVAKGDHIALSGNTGKSTGPHLHFEVRGGKQPFAN